MRAKVNPKPAARNGAGRVGSTGKASEGTEQIEAGKGRSQQRRQSERHEAILVPSGANAMHPKSSEARPRSGLGLNELLDGTAVIDKRGDDDQNQPRKMPAFRND